MNDKIRGKVNKFDQRIVEQEYNTLILTELIVNQYSNQDCQTSRLRLAKHPADYVALLADLTNRLIG